MNDFKNNFVILIYLLLNVFVYIKAETPAILNGVYYIINPSTNLYLTTSSGDSGQNVFAKSYE